MTPKNSCLGQNILSSTGHIPTCASSLDNGPPFTLAISSRAASSRWPDSDPPSHSGRISGSGSESLKSAGSIGSEYSDSDSSSEPACSWGPDSSSDCWPMMFPLFHNAV